MLDMQQGGLYLLRQDKRAGIPINLQRQRAKDSNGVYIPETITGGQEND
jgi:hypothetical protein